MILEELFDHQACPTAHIQIFLAGDPKQLLVFDKDGTLAKNKCFCADVAPFQTKERVFSKFFETVMQTGLRIQLLTIPHRMTDPSFLETLNLVGTPLFCNT